MASQKLNLPQILFQEPLRSAKVRNNFDEIQAQHNALIDDFNALSTPASGSEVVTARNYLASLDERITEQGKLIRNSGILDTIDFKVSELSGGAGAGVDIAAGIGMVDGVGVKKTAVTTISGIAASSAGNHRLVAIVIDSANTISAKDGAEVLLANPVTYPAFTIGEMILGHFIVDDGAVVIADADIFDDRLDAFNPFQKLEATDMQYTYTGDQIDTAVAIDKKGVGHTFTFVYAGDKISTITATIDSITYTQTYTYTGDQITSSEIILS